MSVQEAIMQAVRAVFIAVTGATSAKVIPADDKGQRPGKPYVTIKVLAANAGDFGPAERVDGTITAYSLSIDTATDGESYGVALTSPSAVSVAYIAGASSTAASIAEGLADAWNADGTASAACSADGTTTPGTVAFSNAATRESYALAEGDNPSKITLSAAVVTPSARMRERREATISIQGYGSTAMGWLDDLALVIDGPASLAAQQTAGIALLRMSGPTDLSALLDTEFEGRSSMELRARHLLTSTTQTTTELGSTVLTGDATRYSGDPDPLSIDATQP